jgi:hypothetical protein
LLLFGCFCITRRGHSGSTDAPESGFVKEVAKRHRLVDERGVSKTDAVGGGARFINGRENRI